jgi:holliday junction DNA helicase RuvA
MFNSISGIISYKGASEVYVQNGGVEWALQVTASTLEKLPAVGEEARIFTYLHHKEDQMTLFGFSSSDQRSVFLDLIKVSGIGPKQAIKILSGMSVDDFVISLDNDDVDNLSRIPGLGRKTAQKIVLALRGKLSLQSASPKSAFEDIITALVEMGFERQNTSRIVERIAAEMKIEDIGDDEREKELFRRSIVLLSANK